MKKSVLLFTMIAFFAGNYLHAQEPAITFKTTKTASITMEFACQDSTTLFIDWGDGVKVETVAVADSATAFLERGYQRTEISGTPVGETVKIYGDKILYFDASGCGLTSLTIDNAPLMRLFASTNDLTTLDVTKLPNLEYLEINTNANLGAIDVTKNPKLMRFVVNNTAIETINLSQNPNLYYLNVNNTKLSTLDVTKNTKLGSLYALNLGLTDIDLTQNKKMFYLSVNGNNLEHLNLAQCDTLIYLYATGNKFKEKDAITFPVQSEKRVFNMMNLSKNYFTLSTLPDMQPAPMTSSRYTYAPQALHQIEKSYEVGQAIDLSSEKELKGILDAPVATTYTWATQSGTVLAKGTDYEEPETGVFKFLTAPEDSVVCTMSTTAFPKFKTTSSYKTVATKIAGPAITFKTTKTASITMEFACQDSTTLFIDWGDGVKVETVAVADSATAFLERGYQRTEISGTPVGETVKIYGDKILYFDASGCELTSLTIDNAPLMRLFASTNDLTTLDVTKLPNLEYLEINTNANLGAIDVTKNPKLMRFVVNNTAIETINLSQNPNLYYLNVNNTKLSTLDVTKNTKLGSLYALNLGLTDIDLTQNKKMFYLSVNGNNLEHLNLAQCDTLIYLYATGNKFKEKDAITFPVQSEKRVFNMMNLSKNYFTLSTLPDMQPAPMTSSRYLYAPQALHQIEKSYEVGQAIDLSSEKELKGILDAPVATTYTWATQSGTVLAKGTDYEEPETGVFKFLTAPEDSVVCTLSTTAFPKFKTTSSYKTIATKIELANSINQNSANAPYAVAVKDAVRFMNIETVSTITVMSLNGQIIYTGKPVESIALPAAVYVIKMDGIATKVAVH